ncbi:MAG: glycosyltransferase family 4 protein [Planctomycetota bacterium]|jgi:glycosyltransferase involved in cell wall biosynthesis
MERPSLKILQIMECTIGGTRRHLRELSSGLAKRGHEVTAICSAERDPTFRNDMEQMREAGVEVIELPMVRSIAPGRDLRHFFFLCRFLRKRQFDIIHTHSSKAGVLGRAAALLCRRCRLVHTPHTFAFAFKGYFSFWKRALFMDIERFLCRRTARIIHVSESERREGLQYGILKAEQAAVAENGIDPWAVRWADPPEEGKSLFSGRNLSPRLGTVGLLNSAKGHDILLHAFVEIVKEFPEAGLAIVGEGKLRPRLEKLIDKLGLDGRAILTGYRNDIPRVLKELDLFVLPSLWEGMPYVVMEAMASGLPVVATDVNGSRDLVAQGETGLIVPPGDKDALAGACMELLRKPVTADNMGKYGLRRVLNHFTLETMLDKTEAIYREVISQSFPIKKAP